MNFDFQVPKRYSHRVTTSSPTLYASTADAEVEGSGLPDVDLPTRLTTAKKIVATPGDMSAYFTTARPTTTRIVTTVDWKQKMYSYGQYAKEIRQRTRCLPLPRCPPLLSPQPQSTLLLLPVWRC